MELSPDQFASLKRVLTEPAAKVAAVIGLDHQQAAHIIETAVKISRRATALGREQLLLVYSPGQGGGRTWNDSVISELIRNNTRVASIGDDGRILNVAEGQTTIINASTLSDPDRLTALCSGGRVILFAAGKPVAELGSAPRAFEERLDWERSWTELPECINDHFTNCIANEQSVRYWADRRGRILFTGPDGTERLFHHSLFWWLSRLIKDALDVYGEAQSMGQDKTDITIVAELGSVVVEVKWLGRNEKGTKYAQVRIEEGMRQVADYLQRNSRLIKGYLVIYDARDAQEHQFGSSYPPNCRHSQCEEPIIFFLRSETPSELASRTATG